MHKVLVTGGSGYLGNEIVKNLIAKNFIVSSFDLNPIKLPKVKEFLGDLQNKNDVEKAISGQDIVFHIGGFADLNDASLEPDRTVSDNILGTVRVLNACKKYRIKKLIFASTIYVYSHKGGYYRISKQACESYIEEFHKQNKGLEYTILRYGSLYGNNSNEKNGLHKLLKMAILKGEIYYSGTPEDRRDYIHVSDAADLSVGAIDSRFNGQRLVISGGNSLRSSDLFNLFEELLNKKLKVNYINEPNNNHYKLSPYSYTPKFGKKYSSTLSIDIGEGILKLIETISEDQS